MFILNATQHEATLDQREAGVFEPRMNQKQTFCAQLTFSSEELLKGTPTMLLEHRAHVLADMAAEELRDILHREALAEERLGGCFNDYFTRHEGSLAAMMGGLPALMAPLERALKARGIRPLYAVSDRVSVDQPQADGSVRKVAVFQHKGFLEV